MNLFQRVKNILLDPKAEWPVIEREPGDAGYLFPNYVMILAAIPVVCAFIGSTIIGMGTFRLGIFAGLTHAVVGYVLNLVGVFVMAFVIDALAPNFGGVRNFANAMRISAYFPTAAWVVGVFSLIPALAFLSILGLYSFYLLYTGLALMRAPADKAIVYTVAVVVCAIVVWTLVFVIPAMIIGMRIL